MMLFAIILSLALGAVLAASGIIPPAAAAFISNAPYYCLCFMLLLVGYGMGKNKDALRYMLRNDAHIFFVPLATIVGTLLGGVIASFLLPLGIREAMAVAGGFGWYTYSAVYLAEVHSADLGAIAFLSNVGREIFAFLLIPLAVRLFGAYPAVTIGGATTMDVTLPIIKFYAGDKAAMVAFMHGAVLSFITPVLLPLIIGF